MREYAKGVATSVSPARLERTDECDAARTSCLTPMSDVCELLSGRSAVEEGEKKLLDQTQVRARKYSKETFYCEVECFAAAVSLQLTSNTSMPETSQPSDRNSDELSISRWPAAGG